VLLQCPPKIEGADIREPKLPVLEAERGCSDSGWKDKMTRPCHDEATTEDMRLFER
jgi:hypothetical protein